MTGDHTSRPAADECCRKGAAKLEIDLRSRVSKAERPEVSGRDLSIARQATTGRMARNTKLATDASVLKANQPHTRDSGGSVPDSDRLTEPVWACRNGGTARSCSSRLSPAHPGVKRVAYSVQGLLVGTQEPAQGRRYVTDRLALQSRATALRGGGASVVVRGRESRLHGEGKQVRRRAAEGETGSGH